MESSSPAGDPPPILLDACVVLSLYATRHMEEILDAVPGSFLVAETVVAESLYIQVMIDGVQDLELVNLDPLIASGKIAVIAPESEEEFQSFLELSQRLDDGEAMTCALALHRGYRVATDDGKTIKLMGQQIPIIGGLHMVRAWAETTSAPPALLRDALIAICNRGYFPGQNHPHRAWWDSILDG